MLLRAASGWRLWRRQGNAHSLRGPRIRAGVFLLATRGLPTHPGGRPAELQTHFHPLPVLSTLISRRFLFSGSAVTFDPQPGDFVLKLQRLQQHGLVLATVVWLPGNSWDPSASGRVELLATASDYQTGDKSAGALTFDLDGDRSHVPTTKQKFNWETSSTNEFNGG